jgi:uncharacterized membrane protein YkoI
MKTGFRFLALAIALPIMIGTAQAQIFNPKTRERARERARERVQQRPPQVERQAPQRERERARERVQQRTPQVERQAPRIMSPGDAASNARQQQGGQVISNELVRPPGEKPYYRVKIIENGKVRTVRVDAGG